MENAHLREMDGHQLIDTLRATSGDLDFADDFTQVYEEILHRSKEKNDLRHLKKAQDLLLKQSEFMLNQWVKHYEPPTLTHDARYA